METNYNEPRKTQVCSLKNIVLLEEPGYFSGTRKLELNLEKINNESLLAIFCLSSLNKSSFFRPQAPIIFTLIHKDNSRETMALTPTGSPQDKSSPEPNYLFLNSIGYMGVLNYREKTTSMILSSMTKEQIIKIAEATKVLFSLETMDEPLQGELDEQALQPFREFLQTCFLNSLRPLNSVRPCPVKGARKSPQTGPFD